ALGRGVALAERLFAERTSLAFWQRAAILTVIATLALVFHKRTQERLAERARLVAEPSRAPRRLEPLGWARGDGVEWGGMGQWIKDHAAPGDTMAAGAAGAMPYHAGIPNLDLFGLCDEYVAHHGDKIGSRPGHQRFAPMSYIKQRAPTFLVLNSEDIT